MKRCLLSLLVLGLSALALVPSEAQACRGRFRARLRAALTAPLRLFPAVRARRAAYDPAGICVPGCSGCVASPCGDACPAR